jgi:hypothetical protein
MPFEIFQVPNRFVEKPIYRMILSHTKLDVIKKNIFSENLNTFYIK